MIRSTGSAGWRNTEAVLRVSIAKAVLCVVVAGLVATSTGCGYYGYDQEQLLTCGGNCPDAAIDSSTLPDAGSFVPIDCAGGSCRRVFVTSVSVNDADFGGLARVDDFCNTLAASAALGGTYLAWASDYRNSASSRFTRSSVPYALLDGTIIANDWADLVDGSLAHAIDVTERGEPLPISVEVWTGTRSDGSYSGSSCSGWTNGGWWSQYGTVGTTSSSRSWTDAREQYCGRSSRRIYCFEQ